MDFELVSEYKPTGDQPEAINQIVDGFNNGIEEQTLQGVTGSGKTFTMANVIKKMNQPIIQEPGGGACDFGGQIERYVPPEPFCVVFIKRSFPILSSQFERVGVTNWTLNLSSFVGRGYAEIKECALCVNGANGTNSFFYNSIVIPE